MGGIDEGVGGGRRASGGGGAGTEAAAQPVLARQLWRSGIRYIPRCEDDRRVLECVL